MITFQLKTVKVIAGGLLLLSLGACDKERAEADANYDSHLVRYLPFSGNSMDDITGHTFNTNGATYLSDRKGTEAASLFFNGFSNWMDVPSGIEMPEGTISFWIFPCLCKENNPLFVKKDVETDDFFGKYYIGYSEEGRVEVICQGKMNMETEIVIEANRWYFITVRWDDAQGIADIFVNAKKVLTANYTVDPSKVPNGDEQISLGKIDYKTDDGDVTSVYYKGKLDDVRVYNKYLPYDAINALYTK